MHTKDTTNTTTAPGTVSAFVRLAEIFRAAGNTVELLAPYPPLPDPNSPRERYRRETIARANERANEQARRRDE